MKLVPPSIAYKESFMQALKEYQADSSDDRKDVYALHSADLEKDFSAYVSKLDAHSKGKELPERYVSETTFWLIDHDEVIGRVSIRHRLTEFLLTEAGHIGYDIRPSKRKKGYGKKILELALLKAKEIGLKKVLVTCDETNIGSRKIIEANGGVFENALQLHEGKPKKLRYWISIE